MIRKTGLIFGKKSHQIEDVPGNFVKHEDPEILQHHGLPPDALHQIVADFGDMLTLISGYTEIALKKMRSGHLTEEDMRQILKAVQRGEAQIGQALALFPLMSQDNAETVIDLTDCLRGKKQIFRLRCGADRRLKFELPVVSCPVRGCPDAFEYIVMQLLQKIFSVSRKSQEAVISLFTHEKSAGLPGRVVLVLRAAEVAERNDADFHPPASAFSSECDLSLYFIYSFIERMGGFMTVFPDPEKQGAAAPCYKIILPLSA
ncbi:MAG: hypothetical protein EA357_09275 [Micavibrio sp.]|nr:MAG: hypothetical protein EA357_09275 [Micavibrio sp.]